MASIHDPDGVVVVLWVVDVHGLAKVRRLFPRPRSPLGPALLRGPFVQDNKPPGMMELDGFLKVCLGEVGVIDPLGLNAGDYPGWSLCAECKLHRCELSPRVSMRSCI